MLKKNIENIQEVLFECPELKPFYNLVLAHGLKEFEGKKYSDGSENFCFYQNVETKLNGTGRFESHIKYIDVHLILKGEEGFEYNMSSLLTPITDYNYEKDARYYSGKGEDVVVKENEFIVFYPNEAHLCAKSNPASRCEKIVFKIKKDI